MNRRLLGLAGVVIGLVAALGLPRLIYPVLALDILLWGLFAVAVDLLLGFAGLLSFGHAMFWGSAGYVAGYLARSYAVDFPIAVLAGTAAAAVLALPVGFLAIRRRGIYFAMVTLAFAQMIFYVVNEWRPVTGGENGLQGIPRTLGGVTLSDPTTFYYAALPIVLLGYLIAYRVVHSPFGHVLVAIRDNEARAQAVGYATWRYKLLGFVLSAGLAGLAGSLYAFGHGFASLEMVRWTTSGTAVVMTILGGIGTLWGSLVGAALVLLLQDWLTTSSYREAWGVVTGAIFAIVVLGFRRGIWGTIGRWLARYERADEPAVAQEPGVIPSARPAAIAEPERPEAARG